MFEVVRTDRNNPFKPEIIDSTVITLKQKEPFVQMTRKYDGDFMNLTDEEAINKVLDDFYSENYNDKIQEGKLTELELDIAQTKETIEEQLSDLIFQNELTSQAVIELTEILLSNVEGTEEEIEDNADATDETEESEVETDGSSSDVDGDENQEE